MPNNVASPGGSTPFQNGNGGPSAQFSVGGQPFSPGQNSGSNSFDAAGGFKPSQLAQGSADVFNYNDDAARGFGATGGSGNLSDSDLLKMLQQLRQGNQ